MNDEIERYTPGPVESRAAVEIVNERTDGWVRVIQPVAELASQVAGTEFVPVAIRQKPAAITAAILFGRELDMPPMQALQQVHVIEGRPSLSAEQQRAMVLAAGHEIAYDLSVPMQVTATGRRRVGLTPSGTPQFGTPTAVVWNIAMAERAGLAGKPNWKRHPRQMLEARATAELCRLIFADVTHGLPTSDELEDGGALDNDTVDQGAPAAAPSGRTKVSRAKPRGTSKAADGPVTGSPPVQGSVPSAPRPPLPGAVDVPTVRDDQGRATTAVVTMHGGGASGGSVQIGEMPAGGSGPVTGEPAAAVPAAVQEEAAGPSDDAVSEMDRREQSEGDGSPDDVAATGTDESYMQARFREQQAAAEDVAEGGIVPDGIEGIHPGQKRALEAAFGSLGVKDRAEIHHAASAMLGRRVETLGPITATAPSGLSSNDASILLTVMSKIRDREQLEALIQEAAAQWEQNRDA